MLNIFDYFFNVKGDFDVKINGMSSTLGKFNASMSTTQKGIAGIAEKMRIVGMMTEGIRSIADGFNAISASGISLDSQLHDLSAVANVSGESLKQIEGYARESAKTFGTNASTAVEGYKLLLSQLSPELGKFPTALQAMGNCIQTTSKLMGGDGVAAAEVLTTAMNQYGVSLKDPAKASEEMARMMNVMAAAGQAGSAELPAIKMALQQCGMAAKAANVSFEETNAAIQVLDKAGKKGAEGGVALRNVLAILSRGRFLPKNVQEELSAAGISINKLSDNTKPLKERLNEIKPLLKDDALLSATFGRENANAARALIQGTDALEDFTAKVTGTSSAEDQAGIVMASYAERQARINQKLEDMKISLFQATGNFGLWVSTIASALIPIAQISPLITLIGKSMLFVKNLKFGEMWTKIRAGISTARMQMWLMNSELRTGTAVSIGFRGNMMRAVLALVKFATVGIFQALKGLGALVLSFITGGTASSTFAGVASASFTAFKVSAVSACKAVGIAIKNIPVIGWIIAIIGAIVGLGVILWKKWAGFRAFLKGVGAAIGAFFKGLLHAAATVFGGIWKLIKSAFTLDFKGMGAALKQIGGAYVDFGKNIGSAFSNAYNKEMDKARAEKAAKEKKKKAQEAGGTVAVEGGEVPDVVIPATGTDVTGGTLSMVGSTGTEDKSSKIKNVNITIDKLVEKFEIRTTNLKEDMSKVKEMVSEALMSAVNDVNLAM